MKFIFTCILIIFTQLYTSAQTTVSIDSLLSDPFDLQKFKKIKGQSNSGGANKEAYYYKPAEKGVYYRFFMFRSDTTFKYYRNDLWKFKSGGYINWGLEITTFKPEGKYRDEYFDPNETLIEVYANKNDFDLPELAFVGLDTIHLKRKLGEPTFRKDSCFIYTKGKMALTFKIDDEQVKWLKYTRLKFALTRENIPAGLLLGRQM